ncbi:MAG TPA: hypothetical protein VE990_07630, partial [Acidimicrobiales bacterium]|nr:hypothetical protein [Acidimicrobiales bacterium]
MAENDFLRRYLDAGIAFTQLTRDRAEELVRELVRAGEVQREQTQQWVEELVERGRRNREQVAELVRRELRDQLESTPLATRIDLDRLESRLAEL